MNTNLTQSTPQSEQGFVPRLNVNQVTARKRKRRCAEAKALHHTKPRTEMLLKWQQITQ